MVNYVPRIIDSELKQELDAFGAVLIVGPKWCGKTSSAEQIAKSRIYMQDPDHSREYLEIAAIKPTNLLVGDNPRLIDEWQMAPVLWDAVRFSVDHIGKSGLYILTGSTTVNMDTIAHSGAGRINMLRMRTMSLFESMESTGEISLNALFNSQTAVDGKSHHDLTKISELIVRGGWPASLGKSDESARRLVAGYCRNLLEIDMNAVDRKRRNPRKMRSVLKSLSRNTATTISNSKILADICDNDESMHPNTLSDYLDALRNLYLTDDVSAWSPKLRSKTTIRTSDVRYLTDPAIAAYFLDANAKDLEYDPNTLGLLFESLVIRDIRIYASSLGGEIYHYRDKEGLEADAIIHLNNGMWAAVEIKLNNRIDEGAKNLLKLKRKVDDQYLNKLSFLAVITATGYAYTRDDGVHVIPIGCLKN